MRPKKLALVVIDGMRPASLRRAVEEGIAPTLARLLKDGYSSDRCISSFPSLTPVATSTITTGAGPDRHGVPSMHWYHRDDRRYVDYGISFPSARRSGVLAVLRDLVYTINDEHLSPETPTFFERLETAGIRCACTTYMIYRGPHEHGFIGSGLGGIVAGATGMSRAAFGPSELVYADIFDSQGSGCRSSYGVPGRRDQHSACAAVELVKNDAYDFLLLSLPDNDHYSHRAGPAEQHLSIAHADEQLQRVVDAAGGYRSFMDEHAVIVVSDHSHSHVSEPLSLLDMLEQWPVLEPRRRAGDEAKIAVSPAARFGSVWVLDQERAGVEVPLLVHDLRHIAQIEHVVWREGDEVAVASGGAELRFAPGDEFTDTRGLGWSVDGDLAVLGLTVADGRVDSKTFPDALARAWSAAECANLGEVLVTPKLGYEFLDWGGIAHVGGGSHGSLHEQDSAAQLIVTGTAESRERQQAWSIADVFALVLEHFGLEP